MTKNTVLLAVAFGIAGMVSVSCGGDSGTEGSDSGAGTTSTTAGTAGTSTTGGTNNPGGGTNATAGTNNPTSGNGTGGTNNPGGGNTTGGNAIGGNMNTGGNIGNLASCPAGTMDGGMCTRAAQGMSNSCQLDADTVCNCPRARNGMMTTYNCFPIPDFGGGGQGPGPGGGGQPGFGNAMCGDAPMDGDACTMGPGLCAGANNCFCFNNKVTCQ